MAGSSPQHCFLWDLPQELIDMVFNLAFQRPTSSKWIYKGRWDNREEHHKKENFSGYVKKPFPQRKIEDFLVSKRFFTAASQAWFSSGTWSVDDRNWRFSIVDSFLECENGLFFQYAKKLKRFSTGYDYEISKMAGLRELELKIGEDEFDELGLQDRYAWEHQLDEHELAKLPILGTIGQMTWTSTRTDTPRRTHK